MVAMMRDQMSFADCVDKNGLEYGTVAADKAARIVYADQAGCADLFDLSDYRVTSHCGGVYYLRKRGGGGMMGTR